MNIKYYISMTFFLLGIFSALLLSGCAQRTFVAEPDKKITVKWLAVDNVDIVCRQLTSGTKNKNYNGCAVKTRHSSHCLIITGKHFTHEILGHELHHCFYGQFHE